MIQTSHTPYRSGIDDLLATKRPRKPVPLLVRVNGSTLSKYAALDRIPIWKATLLHSRANPDWMGIDGFRWFWHEYGPNIFGSGLKILFGQEVRPKGSKEDLLCQNLKRVEEEVLEGNLEAERPSELKGVLEWKISVRRFHEWSTDIKLPVIGPWPTPREAAVDGVALQFPRETPPLRQLRAAAWWFAEQCNQAAGSAARPLWPSNPEIREWAVHQFGTSINLASAMATIVRAGLPEGRRPKRLNR